MLSKARIGGIRAFRTVPALMSRPAEPTIPGTREELGIDHWTRTAPIGALLAAFCISKGYYQLDAETLIVAATATFGFGLYTSVGEMVRKEIHATEVAAWNETYKQESEVITCYRQMASYYRSMVPHYDMQVLFDKEMAAHLSKVEAKIQVQKQMLKRQGIINSLKLRIQEVDSVQSKAVEETINDINATAAGILFGTDKTKHASNFIDQALNVLEGKSTSIKAVNEVYQTAINTVKDKQAGWVKAGSRPVSSYKGAELKDHVNSVFDNAKARLLAEGLSSYELKNFLDHVKKTRTLESFNKDLPALSAQMKKDGLSQDQIDQAVRDARAIILQDKISAETLYPDGKVPVKKWQLAGTNLL